MRQEDDGQENESQKVTGDPQPESSFVRQHVGGCRDFTLSDFSVLHFSVALVLQPITETSDGGRFLNVALLEAPLVRPVCHFSPDFGGEVANKKGPDESHGLLRTLEELIVAAFQSAFGSRKATSDLRPVDDVPEGRNVVGTAILVVQIVGMLPDIKSQDRRSPI